MQEKYLRQTAPLSAGRRLPASARRSAAVLLLGFVTLATARSAVAQRTVAEQFLFEALNASRFAAGLPGLVWSDRLTRAASQHAAAMGREGTVAHLFQQEPDLPERAMASGVRFSVIAENIGVAPTAADLQDLWVHSPDHLGNMLDPAVNAVGIAVLENEGDLWAVEDFARTSTELSLTEQEKQVGDLLFRSGFTAAGTEAAREMCRAETGYVGQRPAFVMRFHATELTHLPQQLQSRLHQGGVSRAAVGACRYSQGSFPVYSVAVALYR